ncbi:hypothetical protein ZIOFF_065136 [Zingiber officinale]|uniref:Uncharacterized protein n=1 Tax=Zingiber officinale TaxID=94328 RepID=A0A8J5KBA6_ZINOF|nr:hypothetical protein ZIOFF_065136 [Zingiber officinale]
MIDWSCSLLMRGLRQRRTTCSIPSMVPLECNGAKLEGLCRQPDGAGGWVDTTLRVRGSVQQVTGRLSSHDVGRGCGLTTVVVELHQGRAALGGQWCRCGQRCKGEGVNSEIGRRKEKELGKMKLVTCLLTEPHVLAWLRGAPAGRGREADQAGHEGEEAAVRVLAVDSKRCWRVSLLRLSMALRSSLFCRCDSRDLYGFPVRPQYLQIHRDYAKKYKAWIHPPYWITYWYLIVLVTIT